MFAVLPSGERVREVTADAVGDAGAQEEVLSFRRQARKNLGIQVPGDALVLAAEIPGDLCRIDLTFHGQRGKVDAARPALRAAVERAQHHARQRDAVLSQQLLSLVERERQLVGAHLRQLAAQSPPRQGRTWIGPRRYDESEPAGAVSDEEVEAVHHSRILNEMKVVEHEAKRLA